MSKRKYSKEHDWILVEGETGTVGISDHAQEQLGDIVYVELPEIGAKLKQAAQAATVESVKAASEVYSPVSGEVVEINSDLADDPARVNTDPFGAGWFFKLKLVDPTELEALMDEASYQTYLSKLD